MGALILGPMAYAIPHQHIAQVESSRVAWVKEAIASSWLKA